MPATALAVRDPALEAVAALYAYPRTGAAEAARRAQARIAAASPDAAAHLDPLVRLLETAELAACEEQYVRTFELNPVCALEVGWQIYGEQYARGAFLVRMRELAREAGVDCGSELPDHLPNVLRVLARLDGPSAARLATRFTAPAVAAMADRLGAGRGVGDP